MVAAVSSSCQKEPQIARISQIGIEMGIGERSAVCGFLFSAEKQVKSIGVIGNDAVYSHPYHSP